MAKRSAPKFSRPNCCGKSFVGKEMVFGGGVTPELPLILEFNDGGASTVGDPSIVANWNALFILPGNGNPFTSVIVAGNTISLYGGTGISLKPSLFDSNPNIVSITDNAQCVVAVGQNAFASSAIFISASLNSAITFADNCFAESAIESFSGTSAVTFLLNCFFKCAQLTTITLPAATTLGDNLFEQCFGLVEIILPVCTALGSTVGDNNVFRAITGNTISLTVPSALMTVNGGNPDGDIQTLVANNTVTITQV